MNRIVTDNTQTLANALDRIKALESLLARCGDTFMSIALEDSRYYQRQLIAEIDAILPSTEENKDE